MPADRTAAADGVERMLSRFDRADGPGLSVGVLRRGEVLLRRGYGLADVDTGRRNGPDVPMRIASLSKQFLVTAVLMLEAEGRLSAADDVRTHLPSLPDYEHQVRLADLMSNQSGIRDFLELRLLSGGSFADDTEEAESMRLVEAQRDLNFAPGSRFVYSNTGFMLLTRIVERIEGARLEEVLAERIFKPLGMNATALVRRDKPAIAGRAIPYVEADGETSIGRWGVPLDGAGGIVSTIDDLLVWASNLRKPRVGCEAIFARMSQARPYRNGGPSIYGLGMTVMPYRGLHSFGHHGQLPGVFAEIAVFPEADTTIILIANTSALNPFLLGRQLADVLLGNELAPVAKPSRPPAGLYHDRETDAVIEISERDGVSSLTTAMVDAPIEFHAPGRFRQFWPMSHLDLAVDGDALVGSDGPRTVRFERLAPYRLSPADLAGAEGTFRERSLNGAWSVERQGADLRLALAGPFGGHSFALTPLAAGLFQARMHPEPVGPYRPVVRIAGERGSRRMTITTDRTFGMSAFEN